jgi:ketosteroid isomerase-like protein
MALSDVEVVQRALEAFDASNVDALLEWCTEDVEMRSAIVGGAEANVYRGHDGMRQWARERDEAFDEVVLSLHDASQIGGLVVALGRISARGAASGVMLDADSGWVVSVRDGRIATMHGYLDHESALEAARAGEK